MTTATQPRIRSGAIISRVDAVICLASGLGKNRLGLSNASCANVRGAILQAYIKRIGLIVMSGGLVSQTGETESELMVRYGLEEQIRFLPIGITLEKASRNTADQALHLLLMAEEYGWKKVVIVCQPAHRKRVEATFNNAFENRNINIIIVDAQPAYGNCDQWRWNGPIKAWFWNWLGLRWYKFNGWA